jgi:hypothetical protein
MEFCQGRLNPEIKPAGDDMKRTPEVEPVANDAFGGPQGQHGISGLMAPRRAVP